MLEKKNFAMSTFMNLEDLLRTKAKYYEEQAEKLEMERVVLAEQLAHLERVVYKLSKEHEDRGNEILRLDDLLADSTRTVLGQALTLEAKAETIDQLEKELARVNRFLARHEEG